MSRSYKKHPCYTCAKTVGMKKLYNRIIRHSREENPYRHYKKRNESWDICDYKCWPDKDYREMDNYERKWFVRK